MFYDEILSGRTTDYFLLEFACQPEKTSHDRPTNPFLKFTNTPPTKEQSAHITSLNHHPQPNHSFYPASSPPHPNHLLAFSLKFISLLFKFTEINQTPMQDTFHAALKYIKELPPAPKPGETEITNEDKLEFYALFKQATEGENTTKSPSRLKVVEKFKWDAWKKLGKITKEEAMKKYIEKLTKLNPSWNGKAKL